MKQKKDFIWGLLCGAVLALSLPAVSMANQVYTAIRTTQTIYLDEQAVDWTVYNVMDENYIRLADLCPELGVGLVWDPVENAVRMNSDGTIPDITPAPEVETQPEPETPDNGLQYYSTTNDGLDIPFPLPDLSYFSDASATDMTNQVNYWANTTVHGILSGYQNLNTTDYVSQVTAASMMDSNGDQTFYQYGTSLPPLTLSPVSTYSDFFASMTEAMSFVYVLETRDGDSFFLRIDVVGYYDNEDFITSNMKVLASYSATPDYYYTASNDDGGFYLLLREPRNNLYTNSWDFPAYHYGTHQMVGDYLYPIWGEHNTVVGWE